jgi:ADP-ribosyl-[dinitrogen reductase] hydrolase
VFAGFLRILSRFATYLSKPWCPLAPGCGLAGSTGAICGNLLGTLLGVEAIPEEWLAELEARDIIERMARDLADMAGPGGHEPDFERYPPR